MKVGLVQCVLGGEESGREIGELDIETQGRKEVITTEKCSAVKFSEVEWNVLQ